MQRNVIVPIARQAVQSSCGIAEAAGAGTAAVAVSVACDGSSVLPDGNNLPVMCVSILLSLPAASQPDCSMFVTSRLAVSVL